jgi:hypothetical protein
VYLLDGYFLANKQLFANYKWRCDCIRVTTSMQVTNNSVDARSENLVGTAVIVELRIFYLLLIFKNDGQQSNIISLVGWFLSFRFWATH